MKYFSPLCQSEPVLSLAVPVENFHTDTELYHELETVTTESDNSEENSSFCDLEPNHVAFRPPTDLIFSCPNEFTLCQQIDLKKDLSARGDMHFPVEDSLEKRKGTCRPRKCLGKECFKPSKWDVICGRGKQAYEHIGNRRFKIIVGMNLPNYVDTITQADKARIIDNVVRQIREAASPSPGFVKQDSEGNWYDVGMAMARVKVSRAFRDSMTGTLRKSNRLSASEKSKNVREAQNAIIRSCQIEFSNKL